MNLSTVLKLTVFGVVLFGHAAIAQNCPYGSPKPCPEGCCGGGGGAPPPSPPPPGSPPSPPPPPNPGRPPPQRKFGKSGDPVLMETQSSFEASRDFVINTPLGPVPFVRFFVSDPKQWSYWSLASTDTLENVPKPFGTGLQFGSPSRTGLRWWHNFFSMIHVRNDSSDGYELWVRDTDGSQTDFLSTATIGNWAKIYQPSPSKSESPSVRGRLRRTGSAAYEFYKDDGTTLFYDKVYTDTVLSKKYYFLSKKLAPNGQVLFDITYGDPLDSSGTNLATAGTPCSDAPQSGVPYIRTVNVAPGGTNPGQLKFVYRRLNRQSVATKYDCVISEIKWVPPGAGTAVALASYLYNADVSGDVSLFTDGSGAKREFYAYDAGTSGLSKFEVQRGDFSAANQALTVTYHTMNGQGTVTATSGDGPSSTVTTTTGGSSTCLSSTCCDPMTTYSYRTMSWANVNMGDGTSNTTSASQKFYYQIATNYYEHGEFIHQKEDTYGGTSGPSGTTRWYLTDVTGGASCSGATDKPGVIWAVEDKRGNFTVTPHQLGDAGIGIPSIERNQEILGASDRTGTGGLQTTNFKFTYGDGGVQRVDEVSRASAITGANQTITKTIFEAGTNRVAAVITQGETLLYDYPTTAVQTKYRALFYRTTRACVDTATDTLKRVTRIEGPCWVSGFTSTSCTNGDTFPVTEYVYYSDSANDNTRGRLRYVHQYPENTGSSCGSTVLTTEYTSYTPEGLPLEVHYPNYASSYPNYSASPNDKALFTYEDGRVKSRVQTVSGASGTTTWNYENGILTSIQYPVGNYEVFCYRDGTGASGDECIGAFTRSLQWKAKATTANGSAWSERIKYFYNTDYSLAAEKYYSYGIAAPRLEKYFDSDAEHRATWQRDGADAGTSITSSLVDVRSYDSMDNVVGLGPAANSPMPFCATNQYACRHLAYDRANRFVEMDAFPDKTTSTGGSKTCFDYDGQGNVRRVAAGCTYGSSCSTNHSTGATTSCSAAPVDYDVDDFGNTVAVKFPWTSQTSAVGVTRYEYDALGNVIKKQTEQMRADGKYLEYTYDSLGRLTNAARQGGTAVNLYQLRYDSAQVESSCPSLANTMGRLSRRNDSFGYTYYSYDEAGRVVAEYRLRGGAHSCGTAHGNTSPHTLYTYDANGNTTSIRYPRGRTVQYTYTSGTDRVASIQRNYWNGSVWTSPGNIVESVAWEPYGGLRSYVASPSGNRIEYYKAGNLESAPSYTGCSDCGCQDIDTAAHDGTSRIRGVYVSSSASLGSPVGDIYRQVYKWKNDQLDTQYTCTHTSSYNNPVITDSFTYDATQQLLSESTNAASGLGESFTYDLRGNRTRSDPTGPNCQITNTAASGATYQVDLLANIGWGTTGTCNNAVGQYSYTYDEDGRRTEKADVSGNYSVSHSYAQAVGGAGLDSVYHAATITGATSVAGSYGYFYDAFGRRRAKTTAWSTTDESFHDLGHQLLSDSGSDAAGALNYYSSDDYIWLGGRPVDIIRQKFTTSWGLNSEGYYQCDRSGEVSVCGDHFPVTDYLGKPVVVLSYWGGIAGLGRYQAFGAVNRREARNASPHNTPNTTTVMTVNEDLPQGFDGMARALLNKSSYASGQGTLTFNGVTQSFAGASAKAHIWTSKEYRSSTGWPLAWTTASSTPYGIDVEAYDFQFKEMWVWWFWTPLRFPGQYYDAETELHENWNRQYDPQIGRYLEADPIINNQTKIAAISHLWPDRGPQPYSYAFLNPNKFVDPTGNYSYYEWCEPTSPNKEPKTLQFQWPGTDACSDLRKLKDAKKQGGSSSCAPAMDKLIADAEAACVRQTNSPPTMPKGGGKSEREACR